MSDQPSPLEALASAVADGSEAPDWRRALRAAGSAAEREMIAALEAIAVVADAFAAAEPAPAADPDILPRGARWGPLHILEHIGSGRFGHVYRAWDPALDREVALKLTPAPDGDRGEAEIVDEGRRLARVRHPNVVGVFGAQRHGATDGLWMELVDGSSLARHVIERGPLPAAAVVAAGLSVCDALQAVHDAGLLHGDVKAHNVLVDRSGRVVLSDFGTSREWPTAPAARVGGTPAYAAPEVLAGAAPTPLADVFAVGVLLHYLISGEYPDADAAVGRQSQRRRDVPAPLSKVITRALSPVPERRFATAAAMGDALREAAASRRWPSRRRVATHVLLLAATSALVLGVGTRTAPSRAALAPRDWVLIGSVENRTAEAVLDGSVEFALERELSASARFNVVPRPRVEDVLRLMRRDLAAALDRRTAREVALRDGEIRAIVLGRIERYDRAYVISAQVIAPADGAILAVVSERTEAVGQLGTAVQRVATALRLRLGEVVERSALHEPLATVSTSSLRALQLYSKATTLLRTADRPSDPAAATAMLREAVALDPEFALAHLALADALRESQPFTPPQERLASMERAVALAERSPAAERLLIIGRAAVLRGVVDPKSSAAEFMTAATHLEALLELHPAHDEALASLVNVYVRLGRGTEAAGLAIRRAAGRPLSADAQADAGRHLLDRGDLAAARSRLERAQALLDSAAPIDPVNRVWLAFLPAQLAWLRGDIAEASRLTDALAESPALVSGPRSDYFQLQALTMYLTLGRLAAAGRLLDRVPAPLDVHVRRAMVLAEGANRAALRAYLRTHFEDVGLASRVGSFWLDAGLLDRARLAIAANPAPAYLGQLALAEGRLDDAIAAFEHSRRFDARHGNSGVARVARKLAEAHHAAGRIAEAVAVLEGLRLDATVAGLSTGYEWLKARALLARLYRLQSRGPEADAVARDVRERLALADDGHPLRQQIAAESSAN